MKTVSRILCSINKCIPVFCKNTPKVVSTKRVQTFCNENENLRNNFTKKTLSNQEMQMKNINKVEASDDAKAYYDQYYKLFSIIPKDDNGVQSDYYEEYQKGYENSQLTHTDDAGQIKMVDVGHKPDTSRVATACGKVLLGKEAFQLVQENKMKKGDVLSTAKIAGIMAAKRTSSLIPLCHPLAVSKIHVSTDLLEEDWSVIIKCEVHTKGKTGVEMEALTGVSVAALTVYDMCKAVTHDITITDIQLLHKSGGMSGDFFRSV